VRGDNGNAAFKVNKFSLSLALLPSIGLAASSRFSPSLRRRSMVVRVLVPGFSQSKQVEFLLVHRHSDDINLDHRRRLLVKGNGARISFP